MDRRTAKEFLHVRDWLQRAREIVAGGRDAYVSDPLRQEAGDSLMMKIGEAARSTATSPGPPSSTTWRAGEPRCRAASRTLKRPLPPRLPTRLAALALRHSRACDRGVALRSLIAHDSTCSHQNHARPRRALCAGVTVLSAMAAHPTRGRSGWRGRVRGTPTGGSVLLVW